MSLTFHIERVCLFGAAHFVDGLAGNGVSVVLARDGCHGQRLLLGVRDDHVVAVPFPYDLVGVASTLAGEPNRTPFLETLARHHQHGHLRNI